MTRPYMAFDRGGPISAEALFERLTNFPPSGRYAEAAPHPHRVEEALRSAWTEYEQPGQEEVAWNSLLREAANFHENLSRRAESIDDGHVSDMASLLCPLILSGMKSRGIRQF